MEEDNILLSFKGLVTSSLLDSVLQIMESKLAFLEESPKIKKKVFNVLVECLQNLHHHIDGEREANSQEGYLESKSALILISKEENAFFVRTGNYIRSSDSKNLVDRIEKINALDYDELKHYYQEVLSTGSLSEKGTAGLGFIDIARKSRNKLDYEIIQTDKNQAFFCLNVKID